jgi:predicted site-specific integrase-resolvase
MTLFRCFALLCAFLSFSAFAAEDDFDEADMMDESQTLTAIGINQRTLKKWVLEGHLKPYGSADKMYFKKSNVEAVKKAFSEAEKARTDKANEQISNDAGGASVEESRKKQLELREKEKRDRGAGASTEERKGVQNQVDYRQAELEARRKEAEAARKDRGEGIETNRQAEREAAQKQREAEKNAKRL